MPARVDFYVTAESGEAARLRLACRVAEKAYVARQHVIVFCDDAGTLQRFDELLWTFGDGSFVPHDTVTQADAECAASIALTTGPLPAAPLPHGPFPNREWQVLVNLSDAVPAFHARFERIAEFLDARPEVRAAGRERFKAYRASSLEPKTHNV